MLIEVWSDIACPWCAVGKRHLERALEGFAHADEVDVVWRSFQLAPDLEADVDEDLATMLARKYGRTLEEARAMNARVTEVAAGVGLTFDLEHARPSNTFDAHRLTHLAADHGRRDEAVERLLLAYFQERERMADHDALRRVGADIGLDPDAVDAMLDGDAYADAVRFDRAEAQRLGLNAVPAFVLDRTFLVSGAQPPEAMLAAIEGAWEQRVPASAPPS